jgi:DNA polymerase-3 subunit delta
VTTLKGRDIERFLARPDLSEGVVLIYGPDAGLVHENAAAVIRQLGGSATTIDMSTAEPGQLVLEARTPSLFGDSRLFRVRGTSRALADEVKTLLDDPAGSLSVIEAGNLTPKDALRVRVEASSSGRALPCYADTDELILKLIEQSFEAAAIAVDPGVATALRDVLGSDREMTRREIEKLVLYAAESRQLTREDVSVLVADSAALTLDEIADSIGTGHLERLEIALTRALTSNIDPQRILAVVTQHFTALRRWRAAVDAGRSVRDALDSGWPKPHFSRRNSLEQQVRLWSDSHLGDAQMRLLQTTKASRGSSGLDEALLRRACIELARTAATL